LIDLGRQIYSADYDLTLEQNVELAHRFTQTYAKFQTDPKVAKLKAAVTLYQSILEKLNVPDRYFSRAYQSRFVFKTMVLKLVRVFLSLVLALPGYLIHLPLHYIGMKANSAKDKETISQTKLGVILILVPVEYTLIWTLVYIFLGTRFLLYAVVALPVAGYLHILEMKEGKDNARNLLALCRVFYLLLFNPQKVSEIQTLRRGISEGLSEVAKATFGDNSLLLKARKIDGLEEVLDDEHFSLKTFKSSGGVGKKRDH